MVCVASLLGACSGGYVYNGQGAEGSAGQSESSSGNTTPGNGGTADTGPTTNPPTNPTGSTTPTTPPATDPTCVPLADFFAAKMWVPVMKTTCASCHLAVSEFTLDASKDVGVAFATTTAEAKKMDSSNKSLLLAKPTGGDGHQGGSPLMPDSDNYKAFSAFVTAVNGGKTCVTP